MGQYANIKSKRMNHFIRWLGKYKAVDIVCAGKHPIKVESHSTRESFPLPVSHEEVNRHIVKDFKEWLAKNNVCTEEEFDQKL